MSDLEIVEGFVRAPGFPPYSRDAALAALARLRAREQAGDIWPVARWNTPELERAEAAEARAQQLEQDRQFAVCRADVAMDLRRHAKARVQELEAKVARLSARGIEDMQHRIAELEAALREIAEGTEPDRIGRYTYLRDGIHKIALAALEPRAEA